MTDYKESFLRKHRPKIIQKTRTPICLADRLFEKELISDEMYNKIHKTKTEEEQMREIYKYINSTKHFDCMYDWLKENEPDVLEKLEKSDTEAAAPQKKRYRGDTNQTGDETDNHTEFPDPLKTGFSFAKLETWVSEKSQELISELEIKLGEEGMKALKKELNDRELKSISCFSAKDIDDIRKNKELETFLSAKNDAPFPKLTYSMFFKKDSSASTGKKAESSSDYAYDLNSSGYGSYKSDQSLLDLTQNDDQIPDEDVFAECSHTGDTDFNENKDNKDVQGTHYDEMDGQPQPSDQPPNVSPKCPNEQITKNEPLLEDTHGSIDMQENEEANVQDNSESFPSKLLQKNFPASPSDNMPSKGLWDTKVKSEAEMIAKNKDTDMPAPEETQHTVQERDGSSMGFNTATSGAVKDQTGEPSCSNTEPALGRNKRGRKKENKLKKKNDINKLFRDWAVRQCKDSDLTNIVDQISITNRAQHSDYSCFTAENVMVYKNPDTCESQIIFITHQKISTATKTMVHYLMFVCGIKKATLLGPGEPNEQEIEYDESFIRIKKCNRFIFEAFAPALAVFKTIQKEKLYSLI
ncbi:hypothetical protein PGIGA_G00102200 [Pangasianodon gigas]|uniref:Uncharacterized protein n=1 Tax=Pangasianodon gigas TaxID=30993 RepID=A0ACC5XFC1_PANGG|nr:hypothetical protein [Pangasianodon gigas]